MLHVDDIVRPQEPTPNRLSRRDFARLGAASAVGLGLVGCSGSENTSDAQSAPSSSTTAGTEGAGVQTPASQAELTPEAALTELRQGNARFVAGTPMERDLLQQVRATADGQYPFAVVLGCIDSRVPVETVFDQGVGDVFAARVAGNVVNDDILGSMEFACNLAGSKAVVVLGHTSCGAVKGAISDARLGNLTGLVQKIEPAVQAVDGERDASNAEYVDAVAETNVRQVLDQIRADSPVLAGMEADGSIALVGAMYDVASGEVRFL